MPLPNGDPPITQELRDRVLDRLGVETPRACDYDALRAIYRAWCEGIPFDNLRKMVALAAGIPGPLPGIDASDFFEHWLRHGTGGTCWPSSNALYALLRSAGFDARRSTASMLDLGAPSHGTVRVRIERHDWLVDSSMLCNVPLPLGNTVFISDDAVCPAEVEPVDGTHLAWWLAPPRSRHVPCRLLDDGVPHGIFATSDESSRERSPFNQRLFARRNYPGEVRVIVGATRYSQTRGGTETRTLSPDDLCQTLVDEMGASPEFVEQWARSGALNASVEPPAGPKPPDINGEPPSRR